MFSHLTSFLCNVVSLSRVAVVPSGISKEIKGDNKVISLYSSGYGSIRKYPSGRGVYFLWQENITGPIVMKRVVYSMALFNCM